MRNGVGSGEPAARNHLLELHQVWSIRHDERVTIHDDEILILLEQRRQYQLCPDAIPLYPLVRKTLDQLLRQPRYHMVAVTVAIGVSLSERTGHPLNTLIKRTDRK